MQRALLNLAMAAILYMPGTAAQPVTCPALVSEALIAVGDACGSIGRNQACYGNLSLVATPRDPGTILDFDAAGDLIGIGVVETLKLAALTPEVPEWGVAIMALQANLPDTLPGQNVTMVLFGDVEIENRGEDKPPLPEVFVTGGGVNVRQGPSTSAGIVGRVGSTPQQVVGRLADGSWLRVALDDGTDGWVSASVVRVDGDVSAAAVMAPEDPAPQIGRYGPMQAFRLRSGIGRTACSEAPADGILIQTPEGAAEIRMEINRVTVYLASTAAVRAAEGEMRLTLLEGSSSVGYTTTDFVHLDPFQTAVIALDGKGDPTGEVRVEEAQASDYAALPTGLLPRPVDVPVISAEQPAASGIWFVRNDIEPDGVSCTAADGSGTPLGFADGEGEDTVTALSANEVFSADTRLVRTGENTFAGSVTLALDYYGYTEAETFTTATFVSPTRMLMERSVTYRAPDGQACAWQISTDGRYLRQQPDDPTSASPGETVPVAEGRWLRTTTGGGASTCGQIASGELEITIERADGNALAVTDRSGTHFYPFVEGTTWALEGASGTGAEAIVYRYTITFDGETAAGSIEIERINAPGGACRFSAKHTFTYEGE